MMLKKLTDITESARIKLVTLYALYLLGASWHRKYDGKTKQHTGFVVAPRNPSTDAMSFVVIATSRTSPTRATVRSTCFTVSRVIFRHKASTMYERSVWIYASIKQNDQRTKRGTVITTAAVNPAHPISMAAEW